MDQFLQRLRSANEARDLEMTGGQKGTFSLSFRGNELAGEVGEACNILKKLDRQLLNIVGSRSTPEALAEELADVLICVDLIAMEIKDRFGVEIDLEAATAQKFNKTSQERRLKTKL